MREDPLAHFVVAQSTVYPQVLAELRDGQKRSHWMWFIFPQIHGLGSSSMSLRYAIASREQAQAYLAHPVPGPRLRECTRILLAPQNRSVKQIFGYPDDLKFHSSLTLFAEAGAGHPENAVFGQALDRFFDRRRDPATLAQPGR